MTPRRKYIQYPDFHLLILLTYKQQDRIMPVEDTTQAPRPRPVTMWDAQGSPISQQRTATPSSFTIPGLSAFKSMTGVNSSKIKASTRQMQPQVVAKPAPVYSTQRVGLNPVTISAIADYPSLDPSTAYEGLIEVSLGEPMKIVRKVENGQVFLLQQHPSMDSDDKLDFMYSHPDYPSSNIIRVHERYTFQGETFIIQEPLDTTLAEVLACPMALREAEIASVCMAVSVNPVSAIAPTVLPLLIYSVHVGIGRHHFSSQMQRCSLGPFIIQYLPFG